MNPGHEKILETLNDDPVLRFEYYAMRTHNVLDGERALMFAVLVDALDTYVKTRNAKGHRKRAEFNEVDSWIRSRNTGSPFAFENICDSLRLSPDAIRFSLKSLLRERAGGYTCRQNFDRDGPVESPVVCAIHLSHSARAELSFDFVAAEFCARGNCHGCSASCQFAVLPL